MCKEKVPEMALGLNETENSLNSITLPIKCLLEFTYPEFFFYNKKKKQRQNKGGSSKTGKYTLWH